MSKKGNTSDRNRGAKVIPLFPERSYLPSENLEINSIDKLSTKLDVLITSLNNSIKVKPRILSIASRTGIELINEFDIVTCMANKSYTEVTLKSGTILTDSRGLYHYQQCLNSLLFFRTNRSWIVNLKMVRALQTSENELRLSNGAFVPISASLIPELKSRIQEVLF